MAPFKLFGMSGSTCTRRVSFTANELGVPFEIVPVDLGKGEHKQPEHLKRQPFGKIPAIEDGDVAIFESRAIIRYLADKYDKDNKLVGSDVKTRALVNQWLEVEQSYWNGPVSTIVFERVFKKWRGGAADESVVAERLEHLKKEVFPVYEAHLASNQFLAGGSFSLADISHAPYTQYMLDAGVNAFEGFPNITAWWQRVSSRPTWQAALK